MCGIFAVIGQIDRKRVEELSRRMKHRGPDETGILIQKNGSTLSHERLSIMDLNHGKQPIYGTDSAYVIHNGEIYNHDQLRSGELSHHSFHTTCDSEVIVHLYEEYGYEFCHKLDGVFAFVVLDGDRFIAARDPIGIKPLYYGTDKKGNMFFASEMKALTDECDEFYPFPPGYYYTPEDGFVKYFNPKWEEISKADKKVDYDLLKKSVIESTEKRLMSDVPLGVLLSGGLDSSLIASITKRAMDRMDKKLHSFSIGLASAPDLSAAREVAEFLGTEHHEIIFTEKEGIKNIEKLIWHLESYDVTTIRASMPMFLISKVITEKGVKVVLSGEGADEVLGGYLYFHNAPSPKDFQKECIDRVNSLSTADCLRADKSTMASGLETRVPFLDLKFLDVAMSIRPVDKMSDIENGKMEKHIIRKAFFDKKDPYLPEHILFRQKEQFSDGVGYNWIDTLIEYCEKTVSDEEFSKRSELFPHNTPLTKEAFYYRTVFAKHYRDKNSEKSVKLWVPKWQESRDPSGRASKAHNDCDIKFSDLSRDDFESKIKYSFIQRIYSEKPNAGGI